MSFNTFGHMFRVTSFGESHGPAIGCVVDGCPPGIALTEAIIQPWMDKRRPGQSKFVTQRQEPDTVKIMSGVFPDERGQQMTTGTPIMLMIENVDQRSKDYSEIKAKYRPGRTMPMSRAGSPWRRMIWGIEPRRSTHLEPSRSSSPTTRRRGARWV
jgi:chorismate synthase